MHLPFFQKKAQPNALFKKSATKKQAVFFKFERVSPEFERVSPEFERVSPEFERVSPEFEKTFVRIIIPPTVQRVLIVFGGAFFEKGPMNDVATIPHIAGCMWISGFCVSHGIDVCLENNPKEKRIGKAIIATGVLSTVIWSANCFLTVTRLRRKKH
jgi:hypothetical protein